jgi:hypothetical protein
MPPLRRPSRAPPSPRRQSSWASYSAFASSPRSYTAVISPAGDSIGRAQHPRLVRDDKREVADLDRSGDEAVRGLPQAVEYRYQDDADDPSEPVARIRVRALMISPRIPDFFSRRRLVEPGLAALSGRAWSGNGPVERVEVAVNGQWERRRWGRPSGHSPGATGRSIGTPRRASTNSPAGRPTPPATCNPLEAPWHYQGMATTLSSASSSPSVRRRPGEPSPIWI